MTSWKKRSVRTQRSAPSSPRRFTIMAPVVLLAVVGSVGAAVPAFSAPIERAQFHDDLDMVFSNFCGVSGLTVRVTGTVDGSFLLNSHGRDGLAYGHETTRSEQIITDVATGAWVRVVGSGMSKDLDVTDNGDGTLTVTTFGTGNAVMYDEAGNVIARDPGQTRAQILLDDGGTPADPSDDEFLEFLGVVLGSTGVSDDFCEAQLAAYGVQP